MSFELENTYSEDELKYISSSVSIDTDTVSELDMASVSIKVTTIDVELDPSEYSAFVSTVDSNDVIVSSDSDKLISLSLSKVT